MQGTNRLAQRPALSNGNLITLLNTESRGDMSRYILVALLVTVVLGDVVEVVSPDNEGPVHLSGDDGTGQDTATDGDETSERAFLVYWITPDQLVIPSQQHSFSQKLPFPLQ
jgi:hypothetical protein